MSSFAPHPHLKIPSAATVRNHDGLTIFDMWVLFGDRKSKRGMVCFGEQTRYARLQ